MRADAEINRQRILDAARAVLDSGGSGMAAVARRAGVGQGTVYRHFPAWEDLIVDVHRVDLDRLAESGPELLQRYAPAEALRAWLLRLAAYGRLKNGLGDAMAALIHERAGRRSIVADLAALDMLLSAAQEAGEVRGDISAEDLFVLVGFLWRLEPTPDREARAERLLGVVLDGIRSAGA